MNPKGWWMSEKVSLLLYLRSIFFSWMALELIGVEMEGSIREMETCSVLPLGLPSNPFILVLCVVRQLLIH